MFRKTVGFLAWESIYITGNTREFLKMAYLGEEAPLGEEETSDSI